MRLQRVRMYSIKNKIHENLEFKVIERTLFYVLYIYFNINIINNHQFVSQSKRLVGISNCFLLKISIQTSTTKNPFDCLREDNDVIAFGSKSIETTEK
jgi:hypothetical protein